MTTHRHAMPFGASPCPEGGFCFRLWAPADVAMALDVDGRRFPAPFDPRSDGWREVTVPGAKAGSRYQWIVQRAPDDEIAVPDPASRSNPDGVHAASEVVDAEAFVWDEDGWDAGPWYQAVVYEMHIGAFTPEGTFAAAMAKLPALAETGITAVQLMPLSSFAGRFGWGYDGVLHYAPHAAYGTPDELKQFVAAAHKLGLAVMLDVVYNHFGPDGNYLSLYAPQFFTERHHTAWGAAVNVDGERSTAVRDFFVHNALYWLHEYRFDGLRFDAVHAIVDDSTPHLLEEIAARIRERCEGRRIHLVLENDDNDPLRLKGGGGDYDAQWNDDYHHAMHVLLTGEHHGYYGHYAVDPMQALVRVLTEGFAREGASHVDDEKIRIRNPRHSSDSTVPLSALLDCLHNHDQIGNRAFGERLSQLVPEAPMRLAVAMLLLAPSPVMLFMGEERGATTPFQYFADWSGDLRRAVVEGRRREFAAFPEFADEARREQIPNPCEASTFEASKLDWASFDGAAQRAWLSYYRELLAIRRRELWPALEGLQTGQHHATRIGERALKVHWRYAQRAMQMLVNLSNEAVTVPEGDLNDAQVVFRVGAVSGRRLGPWSGQWQWVAP